MLSLLCFKFLLILCVLFLIIVSYNFMSIMHSIRSFKHTKDGKLWTENQNCHILKNWSFDTSIKILSFSLSSFNTNKLYIWILLEILYKKTLPCYLWMLCYMWVLILLNYKSSNCFSSWYKIVYNNFYYNLITRICLEF